MTAKKYNEMWNRYYVEICKDKTTINSRVKKKLYKAGSNS